MRPGRRCSRRRPRPRRWLSTGRPCLPSDHCPPLPTPLEFGWSCVQWVFTDSSNDFVSFPLSKIASFCFVLFILIWFLSSSWDFPCGPWRCWEAFAAQPDQLEQNTNHFKNRFDLLDFLSRAQKLHLHLVHVFTSAYLADNWFTSKYYSSIRPGPGTSSKAVTYYTVLHATTG